MWHPCCPSFWPRATLPVTQVLRDCLNERVRAAGPGRVGCQCCTRLAGGLWGATPAPLRPTFTPFLCPSPGVTWEVASSLVHLQQPNLSAENCPPPPADSLLPPPGNRLCSCSVFLPCGGSGQNLGSQPGVVSVHVH